MKVIIVIPAFNESLNILKVIDDIKENCKQYDYVVVNDGSTDNTLEVLRNNNLNFIDLPLNLGFSGAVQTGYKYAFERNYDIAVQFDGDGQHPAKSIPDLVEALNEGFEYVIGSRYVESPKAWNARMIGSRIIGFAIKITTGKSVDDPTSGMRAISRDILKEFSENLNFVAEPDTLSYFIKRGVKIKEINVKMKERKSGDSYFSNPGNSIKYMINMFLSILFLQQFRIKK